MTEYQRLTFDDCFYLQQTGEFLDIFNGGSWVDHTALVRDHRVASDQGITRDGLPEDLHPEYICHQVLRFLEISYVSFRVCFDFLLSNYGI